MGATGRTYDKAGVELLPRLEDEFSGTRGREFYHVLTQHQIYLSSSDPGSDVVPVLGWVCIIQQVILSVYNRDLLVLNADLNTQT